MAGAFAMAGTTERNIFSTTAKKPTIRRDRKKSNKHRISDFSFEKMALRDAVRTPIGAQAFATALFDLLHGADPLEVRFESWIAAIEKLPRRQTRVLTWPLVTVFGFIAQPKAHFFFKPTVTREAARRYGVELPYASRPSWLLYRELLNFVRRVRSDIADMRPRDMIDMQSYLWVQGSEEYPD